MTTKAEKPTLQGQRIKTRKRDEKAKYDPVGFRDAILQASVFRIDCGSLQISEFSIVWENFFFFFFTIVKQVLNFFFLYSCI